MGETPIELTDLDPNGTYELRFEKDGFRDEEKAVTLGGRTEASLEVTLDRRPKPGPAEKRKSGGGGAPNNVANSSGNGPANTGGGSAGGGGSAPPGDCGGSGAKLSFNAVGVQDCRITVGSAALGVSPFANKDAPVGRCEISVTCADGKRYNETRVFKNGAVEKVIVKPEMWQ
jgi:hypothetical protein